MPGVNRFQSNNVAKAFSNEVTTSSACVFVSYKGDDKRAAEKIAGLLMSAGIDVYFDTNDYMLSVANHKNDHASVVSFIEEGVKKSTHILAVLSSRTKESWWVSFEIGSGRRKGCKIAFVALEDVESLPSYLMIAEKITSEYSLAKWIRSNFSTYIAKSIGVNEVSVPKLPVIDKTITFYERE